MHIKAAGRSRSRYESRTTHRKREEESDRMTNELRKRKRGDRESVGERKVRRREGWGGEVRRDRYETRSGNRKREEVRREEARREAARHNEEWEQEERRSQNENERPSRLESGQIRKSQHYSERPSDNYSEQMSGGGERRRKVKDHHAGSTKSKDRRARGERSRASKRARDRGKQFGTDSYKTKNSSSNR